MTNFAYLTQVGILHIVDKRETAERCKGQGIVVETNVANGGGYPVVLRGKEMEGIILYGEDKMKFAAKDNYIKDAETLYPHLAELYRQCKN